jgi:hypothetical protein
MLKLVLLVATIVFLLHAGKADAHFFGQTKQIENYQVIFAPFPDIPIAGSNSTFLNFSVLENGSNIFNIHSAVVIAEKESGGRVAQIPYRQYEFSDISIPYAFSEPGRYVVTLQTRIAGDDKYQAIPLEANFDLAVERAGSSGIPIEELLLFYVTPAAVAIAGIVIYLHSKGRI